MKVPRDQEALLRRHREAGAGRLTRVEGNDEVERIHLARYAFAGSLVRGKRVLDCATGIGYGAFLLAREGAASVTGVDISADALRIARERYRLPNLAFQPLAPGRLPFGDGAFDVVVSLETIEHAPDAVHFLDELYRVLVPMGVLIISTPNRRFHSFGRRTPWNPHHAREFSPGEFFRLLEGRFGTPEFRGGQEFLAVTLRAVVRNNWTEFRYYRLLGRPAYSAAVRAGRRLRRLLAHDRARSVKKQPDTRSPVVPWQNGCEPYTIVAVFRKPAVPEISNIPETCF